MLYLAIALVLVGVLCFIYLSLTPPAPQNESLSKGKEKKPFSEEDYRETLQYQKKWEHSREEEERILREREIPPQTIFTKPFAKEEKPEVVESVQVFGKDGKPVKEEEVPEERLIVHGTLYLDTKGKLPLGMENLSEQEWKEEYFLDFRRIGEGALVEEGGQLSFRVKNLTYSLHASDIRQVVFYDEAVVFMPNRKDYATAVFFTKDTEAVKAFFTQAESKPSEA